CCLQRD
ncbi:hypothetical protein AVEN_274959-1, partial [Araneus ventricosus]